MNGSLTMFEPRELRRGWLLKRKDDRRASNIFCEYNKRFFALDFERRVLSYGTSETKPPTFSIPFSDILDVTRLCDEPATGEPSAGAIDAEPDTIAVGATRSTSGLLRSDSKSSITSGCSVTSKTSSASTTTRKLSGCIVKYYPKHGFAIQAARGKVGTPKVLEFMCYEKAEADTWLRSVSEAIALARPESSSASAPAPAPAASSPAAPLVQPPMRPVSSGFSGGYVASSAASEPSGHAPFSTAAPTRCIAVGARKPVA